MDSYTWTLKQQNGSKEGQGSITSIKEMLTSANLPGITPVDWIVDHLIADGFTDGEAVYHHDVRESESWMLTLRQGV